MKLCALLLMFCAAAGAQSLSFYIDNATATGSLQPLPSTYNFADTPEGSVTSIYLRVVNTSNSTVQINYVAVTPPSSAPTLNFTVTGFDVNATLAPQAWKLFTVNFAPVTTGEVTANLQVSVPGSVTKVATLTGNATSPQITVSCNSSIAVQCNGSILQPSNPTPIQFGGVSTTQSVSIPFTVTDNTGAALNLNALNISIEVATNNPNSPFSVGTPVVSGSSATFNLTFAPGAALTYVTELIVGQSTYALQGSGMASVVGDISSLVITYTDSSGVRLTAQPSSPISAGQVVAGTNATSTLTFNVANPQTTISAVSVPSITASGSGFSIAEAPTLPASIQPGSSITFQLVFSPSASGTYSGSLAIGSRIFSITGQSTVSPIPAPSFQVDLQPLTSQHQAHLTIQLASPSPVIAVGSLTLSFSSAVAGINDDPAINFVTTNGRQLQVSVASGSQTAMYNGQSALTFQTGTTAGTLTFSLVFPNSPPYTQSFTITPAQVQITSSTAQIQPPNLVLTLVGYDDTYSVGPLSFNFYDTSGKLLTSTPITLDATTNFHNYFFINNQAAGAFSLILTFPVSGNISEIGSVAATLQNSAGQTSVTQAFQ